MEVILKQDVKGIGKAENVVKVKDGFAHNFLFPNKLAVPLTPDNLKKLQQEKERRSLESDKLKKSAEELKNKLSSLSLTIPVLTQPDEKLYGSVANQDIWAALKEEGLDIEKNSIVLSEPIKSLGIYEVTVKIHPEVSAIIKIWIVKK